jgi:predicted permease
MLIIIGATLQGAFRRDQARDLVFISVLRLILLPLLYIGIIRALPLPPDLELLAIIVALMPTSAVSPVMARLYGGVPSFASAATLVTHIASLVTVPLAFWWLSHAASR